jgi:hypothetical protein
MAGETLNPYYQPFTREQPFAGMPGGPLLNLIGPQVGDYMQRHMGYTPMGFNYGGDLYNMLQRNEYQNRYSEAIARSAAADSATYTRLAQGAASMLGFANNPELTATFNKAVNTAIANAPFDITAARDLDIVTGGRTQSRLTSGLMNATRAAADPITGNKGYSWESGQGISQQIFNNLFGGANNLKNTSGLSTNDVGELLGELQRRGGLSSDGMTGMSSEDRSRLSTDPVVQRTVRGNIANKMSQQVKEYSGAIAAVRELFGDPTAPIPQLFAQLEQLTGNSLQQIGGGRAMMTVRNMANYAQNANVGLEGLTYMAQYSGELAQRRGLNSAYMPDITMAGLAMREFLTDRGAMATPAWGLSSIEQQGRIAQQRFTGAASSDMANRAGTLMRLAELGVIKEGSAAAKMVEKIKNGVVDDSLRTMDNGSFSAMMQSSSSMSAGEVNSMLRQRDMNSEFIHRNGIADTIMHTGQREDLRRLYLGGDRSSAFNIAARRSVTGKLGRRDDRVSDAMADAAGSALQGMNADQRNSDASRYGIMAQSMYERLGETAGGGAYLETLGRNKEEQMQALRGQASMMYGEFDYSIRRRRGISGIDALTQTSPEAAADMTRSRMRVNLQSMVQASLSGETDPHVLRRMFRQLQDEGGIEGSGAGGRAFAATLNLKSGEELGKMLLPKLQEMSDMYDSMMKDGELSPEERKQLEAKRAAISEQSDQIKEIMRLNKLNPDEGKGEALDPSATSAGPGKGGGVGPIAMSGTITINIDGQAVATGNSGSITTSGGRRGSPPNAGMC